MVELPLVIAASMLLFGPCDGQDCYCLTPCPAPSTRMEPLFYTMAMETIKEIFSGETEESPHEGTNNSYPCNPDNSDSDTRNCSVLGRCDELQLQKCPSNGINWTHISITTVVTFLVTSTVAVLLIIFCDRNQTKQCLCPQQKSTSVVDNNEMHVGQYSTYRSRNDTPNRNNDWNSNQESYSSEDLLENKNGGEDKSNIMGQINLNTQTARSSSDDLPNSSSTREERLRYNRFYHYRTDLIENERDNSQSSTYGAGKHENNPTCASVFLDVAGSTKTTYLKDNNEIVKEEVNNCLYGSFSIELSKALENKHKILSCSTDDETATYRNNPVYVTSSSLAPKQQVPDSLSENNAARFVNQPQLKKQESKPGSETVHN